MKHTASRSYRRGSGTEPYFARRERLVHSGPLGNNSLYRRGALLGGLPALALLGIGFLLACTPLKIDTRSLFARVSYSEDPTAPPTLTTDDLNLQVFANLELEAVMAYRNPAKMAVCLRALANLDETRTKSRIQALGERLATHAKWGRIAATMPLPVECTTTEDPEVLVRFVIARIANSLTYMATAGAMTEEQRQKYVYKRVPDVLNAIASTIERTNPNTSFEAEDSVALALRGGAANGAFSAGFLFELLSLRERALPPEGDGGKFRFSAMVGTSVGALIAQILDLYFVDPKTPLTPTQQTYIDRCRDYWKPTNRVHTCYADIDTTRADIGQKGCFSGWPNYNGGASAGTEDDRELSGLDAPTRDDLFARHPRQMCSLTKLYQSFTDNDEQTLMCVEPGPISRILGWLGTPDQNLMRFDPMSSNIIEPVLDAFSDDMVKNDVTRVVVAVELQNNQVIGLDERTCALKPSKPTQGTNQEAVGGREYCLGSAVMASAVIPAYARPVRHAYDGVSANGFCGSWFDGGLRSVFPAYRALRMTRPAIQDLVSDFNKRKLRVLAVGTGPLQGLKQPRRSSILDITLDAEGQATSQNDLDEIMMARQMALVREQQLCEIMQSMKSSTEASTCDEPDPISDDVSVSAIYVPAETPEYLVAGAEYSFDRTLMRGLWVWGRHVAIERVLGKSVLKRTPKLFERLGWEQLQPKALELAKADAQTMQPWLDAFSIQKECDPHRIARAKAGQNRITKCVPDCAKITPTDTTIAQYFVCPQGASGQ